MQKPLFILFVLDHSLNYIHLKLLHPKQNKNLREAPEFCLVPTASLVKTNMSFFPVSAAAQQELL